MDKGILSEVVKYAECGDVGALSDCIINMKDSICWQQFSKAKSVKLLKQMLCLMDSCSDSFEHKDRVLKEWISWAERNNRFYLKLFLDIRYVELLVKTKRCRESLSLCDTILKTVIRKIDDKLMCIEIHLLESKSYHHLKNLSKAKASLTMAKAVSNSIYCPPNLQILLDFQSGIIYSEEKDYKTSYSFFNEVFEGIWSIEQQKINQMKLAEKKEGYQDPGFLNLILKYENDSNERLMMQSLTYMLLCKLVILIKESASDKRMYSVIESSRDSYSKELGKIVSSLSMRKEKQLKSFNQSSFIYTLDFQENRGIQAILELSKTFSTRSLVNFKKVISAFSSEIIGDEIVYSYIMYLYDNMLEKNILKILAPYESIEIPYVVQLLNEGNEDNEDIKVYEISEDVVEKKICKMRLENKLLGNIDQFENCVYLYEKSENTTDFDNALKIIKQMDSVVSALYQKGYTMN